MDISIIAIVFGVIFISELPDKSMFASLILSTHYHGGYVWAGAASAFLVHVLISVTAGQALSLLPHTVVEAVVALLFFAGAMLLFIGKHGLEKNPAAKNRTGSLPSFWKTLGTSFGIVFLGEWGDITQIATANYTAHYHNPLSVGIGATLGLWVATAVAILTGKKLLNHVPARLLQRMTGIILLGFAAMSAAGVLRG